MNERGSCRQWRKILYVMVKRAPETHNLKARNRQV
ncbi:MAG: hypothetical protein ACI9OW_001674 [Marinobacter psychrophilus]|jgi:hypothetical protein